MSVTSRLWLAVALFSGAACADDPLQEIPPCEGQPWRSFEVNMFEGGEPYDGLMGASSEVLHPAQIYRVYADGRDSLCLTCDTGNDPNNANYHFSTTPDQRHIVYISARDRPDGANALLLTMGGEVYIMDAEDGGNKQRLTSLEGYARAVSVSRDGTVLHWTQVTSDNRWHLLFADLIEEGGEFHLGPIQELRLGVDDDDPPSAAYTRRLAWAEWKYEAYQGDWWSVGATYGGRMNVDTWAVSAQEEEALRLTSNPENEEFAAWDPTGLGIGVMSGRDHYQARQLFPLPAPAFGDYSLVVFGLIIVQTGRAVPWGTDLFFLGEHGEDSMVKLVEGADDGFLLTPWQWAADGQSLGFGMWRVGLANPDPQDVVIQSGQVEFSGRPELSTADRPSFLDNAAIERHPVEVVPFDPEDVVPTVDVTILGKEDGEVDLSIVASLDYSAMTGTVHMEYRDFSDGDYTITGTVDGSYDIPANLLDLTFDLTADLTMVDRVGITYEVQEVWTVQEDLTIAADITFTRPGDVEVHTVRLSPMVLFGGL